jgi:hypothetical protein
MVNNSTPDETPIGSTNGQVTVRGGGNQDQPAPIEADTLGFKPYVEAVFSYLKNPQTKAPFTLSVEGDWGSGKSSFMFQLEQTLTKDKQKSVRFNAWRHDKVESMWAAFALHFIKDLLRQLTPCERLVANIRLRWHHFDWVKGWFSVVKAIVLLAFYIFLIVLFVRHGAQFAQIMFKDDKIKLEAIVPLLGSAGLVIGLLFFLSRVAEVAGNPFKTDLQKFVNTPNYEGNVAFIEKFHRDFSETVNILSGKQSKVYVFVDDLDRADIPKAAELMQGLNMMISNSPKLVFIIGMDREKVAAGIAAKYKDLLPFVDPEQADLSKADSLRHARAFGYSFIEKFIQLSFQIPKPSGNDIGGFIRSLSGTVTKPAGNAAEVRYNPVLEITDGEDTRQFQEVTILLAPFFEDNPRRIKQFVNAFRLKAHIAHSTGLFTDRGTGSALGVLTIPQLGKFIALTMLYPEVVTALGEDPQLFASLLQSGTGLPAPEEWKNNIGFMELLNLAPKDKEAENNYNMFLMKAEPLLETTPAYSHSKTAPAQNGTPATNQPPAPDNFQRQPLPNSSAPDEPDVPTYAPTSGQTATTTTTTKAPNRSSRGPSKK